MRYPCLLAALSLCAGMLLAGCGKPSAEVVVKQYVSLMKAGKFEGAAKLWDLDSEGRAQNSDWDTFGESQRTLIIQKDLAPKRAENLKLWATHFTPETKVVAVTESGDTATSTLEGGRVSTIHLAKSGDRWKIVGTN